MILLMIDYNWSHLNLPHQLMDIVVLVVLKLQPTISQQRIILVLQQKQFLMEQLVRLILLVESIQGQTGLTTARTYYVQADGSLGTSAGNPSVVAGTSISTTQIIVKG